MTGVLLFSLLFILQQSHSCNFRSNVFSLHDCNAFSSKKFKSTELPMNGKSERMKEIIMKLQRNRHKGIWKKISQKRKWFRAPPSN